MPFTLPSLPHPLVTMFGAAVAYSGAVAWRTGISQLPAWRPDLLTFRRDDGGIRVSVPSPSPVDQSRHPSVVT